MAVTAELLEKVRAPLEYAARHDFAALANVPTAMDTRPTTRDGMILEPRFMTFSGRRRMHSAQ